MSKSPRFVAAALLIAVLGFAVEGWSANGYGKLSGTVLDATGTPQLGATIWLSPEAVGDAASQLLTNQDGVFASTQLHPGLYSVRVTLAGFLPTLEQHIRIRPDLTTVVHIELESVLSSLDRMRHQPAQPSEGDDWKWVLRSASATRPILQWRDGAVVANAGSAGDSSQPQPRVRIEMTAGGRPAGSASSLPSAPATAVSYDQPLGPAGRLLLAGEMSYGDTADSTTTLASIWLPSGEFGRGPETIVIVHQGPVVPGLPSVRQLRAEHTEQIALSDRLVADLGAEYLMTGNVHSATATLRPHGRLVMRVSPGWFAALSVETEPGAYAMLSPDSSLVSAMDALDTLPQQVWHDGRSTIAGGWHEELAVRRDVGSGGRLEMAAFHDFSRHEAVFGSDTAAGCEGSQGCSSWVYAHDAGADGSWGTRVVYRQRIFDSLEVAAIYAWAGALTLDADPSVQGNLDDRLQTRYVSSVAGRVSGKVPRLATQFSASYKWLNEAIVNRQDLFGEAALGVDPNLSVSIRQPLPSFRSCGHWEALADFRNILSQGYITMDSPEGQMVFVPVSRSFRGGVSFQF